MRLAEYNKLYLARKGQETANEQAGAGATAPGRKGKRKLKVKLGFVFVFVVFNLSLLLFLNSSYFTITEIHIEGLESIARKDAEQGMGVREGMNIWKVSPPEISSRLEEMPRVKTAEVERSLPGELRIAIIEKKPLALVPYHGYYLELAADGVFIGIRDEYKGDLLLVNGLLWGRMDVGTGIPDRVRGDILQVFLDNLNERESLPLGEVNVEDPEKIIGYSWDGMEVRFGGKEDLSKKIEVLDQIYYRILSQKDAQEGYLDLRVAEAPVFRPVKNNS